MANYDNKLGEWFKQVEKRAEEHLARKRASEEVPETAPPPVMTRQPASVRIEQPVREARSSVLPPLEGTAEAAREIVADVAVAEAEEPLTGAPRALHPEGSEESQRGAEILRAAQNDSRGPALFDDADVPQVEDFLSFLSRSGEHQAEPEQSEPPFEVPKDQLTLDRSEGTGIPRPVTPEPIIHAEPIPHAEPTLRVEPVEARPAPILYTEPTLRAEPVEARPAPKPQPAPVARVEQPAPRPVLSQPDSALSRPDSILSLSKDEQVGDDERWERLPHHLRILFDGEVQEVAQNSYKSFKESRAGLIGRLLDPTISLEEAARVLNVCPTTVRRYTNKGALKHYRTAGNQRRFKLSDVLNFMETGLPKPGTAQ